MSVQQYSKDGYMWVSSKSIQNVPQIIWLRVEIRVYMDYSHHPKYKQTCPVSFFKLIINVLDVSEQSEDNHH